MSEDKSREEKYDDDIHARGTTDPAMNYGDPTDPSSKETGTENAQESYRFINQQIKKKPVNWKKIALHVLSLVASGILIGVIAAFTGARMYPIAQSVLGKGEKSGKITIPADQDPSLEQVVSDPAAASVSTSAEEKPEATEAPTETPTAEPTEEPEPTTPPVADTPEPEAEKAVISLEDYKALYQQMMEVASEPQKSLVQVIGITSTMDYFNQNYENQQQIAGAVIAENETDLFVLTEYRIVENVERIQVTFFDGSTADAIFQKADQDTGLAVLRVKKSGLEKETRDELSIAPLGNSYTVSRGEPVIALGSPLGYSDSVAYGAVTSVTNKVSLYDVEYNILSTDIEGNSAGTGILINLEGQIVGIIAQRFGTNGSSTITGLAISQIKELLEDLSNNVSMPYLGVKGQNVTADISERTGIPVGVLVTEIAEDSPAMLAGIKEYDVIVGINETEIRTMAEYHRAVKLLEPEEVINVQAMRLGNEGYTDVAFDLTVSTR